MEDVSLPERASTSQREVSRQHGCCLGECPFSSLPPHLGPPVAQRTHSAEHPLRSTCVQVKPFYERVCAGCVNADSSAKTFVRQVGHFEWLDSRGRGTMRQQCPGKCSALCGTLQASQIHPKVCPAIDRERSNRPACFWHMDLRHVAYLLAAAGL